jgi:cytochrome c oxidase subunit 3
LIGVGLMAIMALFAWRRKFSKDYVTPLEVAGLYWHFVDMVWVFIFPLYYLISRR